MGHWGIKSYENDDAADAIDAGFERVHGDRYEQLMDDQCALNYEQVQQQLANPETLAAGVAALIERVDAPFDDWDEIDRLAYAGVLVRHAELGVPIPDDQRARAVDWLEQETIDWDESTVRKLRREKEIRLLRAAGETT